jgi:hypothetical protein
VNHDFAGYHIAVNADVGSIEAHWLDDEDPYVNPMGSKGLGEVGIVGTAAAIANAVHHATGIRVRDLPITLDKLLAAPTQGAWRPGDRRYRVGASLTPRGAIVSAPRPPDRPSR